MASDCRLSTAGRARNQPDVLLSLGFVAIDGGRVDGWGRYRHW